MLPAHQSNQSLIVGRAALARIERGIEAQRAKRTGVSQESNVSPLVTATLPAAGVTANPSSTPPIRPLNPVVAPTPSTTSRPPAAASPSGGVRAQNLLA
jgi:hypothetical protein